jgi:catechol 2,3-dioxygenase-like lactoylglutathione lyase family enzyme
MKATQINHVSVQARNLEQSVRFYVDVLGMETILTYSFAFRMQYRPQSGDALQAALYREEAGL